MKTKVRFKCWKCETPFPDGLRNELPPETYRAILRGVRRARYLDLCKKCRTSPGDGGSVGTVHRISQYFGVIEKKHLVMLNWRCQICGVRDRAHVEAHATMGSRTNERYLQRDIVALCRPCYLHNVERLGSRVGEDTSPPRKEK